MKTIHQVGCPCCQEENCLQCVSCLRYTYDGFVGETTSGAGVVDCARFLEHTVDLNTEFPNFGISSLQGIHPCYSEEDGLGCHTRGTYRTFTLPNGAVMGHFQVFGLFPHDQLTFRGPPWTAFLLQQWGLAGFAPHMAWKKTYDGSCDAGIDITFGVDDLCDENLSPNCDSDFSNVTAHVRACPGDGGGGVMFFASGFPLALPLGDWIANGLSFFGITKQRYQRWRGKPCGCVKRQEDWNVAGESAANWLRQLLP